MSRAKTIAELIDETLDKRYPCASTCARARAEEQRQKKIMRDRIDKMMKSHDHAEIIKLLNAL